MDNKNNRLFYWNVKDFLGKQPETPAKKTSSLKNSIENVLSENKIYRENNFSSNESAQGDIGHHITLTRYPALNKAFASLTTLGLADGWADVIKTTSFNIQDLNKLMLSELPQIFPLQNPGI